MYKQKGVDTLLTIDLSHVREDYPSVKKIILISSDTDFCPIIGDIESLGVKVLLYTYYEKKRVSKFSVSHHLIDCCKKVSYLTKKDFEEAMLEEKIK